MKTRKPAVRMAQRAQSRGNALHRRKMLERCHATGFGKGLRGPCQQREDFEQFFRTTGRDATFRINLRCAVDRQRRNRRSHQMLHST